MQFSVKCFPVFWNSVAVVLGGEATYLEPTAIS